MVLGWLCVMGMQGCGLFDLIDDDLSVCGQDMVLELRLELETSLDLELETVLSAETDLYTRTLLHDYFSHIFTERPHDISVGFFSADADTVVETIYDASDTIQRTYTFFLKKNNYYAIALANKEGNEVLTLTDSTDSRLARLETLPIDTLPPQRTGIFSVTREIEVQDSTSQRIDLTLHLTNTACALVIDTADVSCTAIRALLCGTAETLYLRDSLYMFEHPKIVRMEAIEPAKQTNGPLRICQYVNEESPVPVLLGCVSLPSADEPDGVGVYYTAKVYVTMPDGKVTETVLSVQQPLRAGQLKVLRLQLQPDGEVKPIAAPEVGATVTLDWKDGGEHNVEL